MRARAVRLWVDPVVHAAECARFESYIVTGRQRRTATSGVGPSAPMGTGATERSCIWCALRVLLLTAASG